VDSPLSEAISTITIMKYPFMAYIRRYGLLKRRGTNCVCQLMISRDFLFNDLGNNYSHRRFPSPIDAFFTQIFKKIASVEFTPTGNT
jgi:hypothetical protein